MFRFALTVAALLASVPVASAQTLTCQTPSPGPSWACVGGGWLPPGHPGIPPSTDIPKPPTFNQPAPTVPFKIGHRYTRNASGTPTDIYVMGAGQTIAGVGVLFAECRSEGDGCLFKGHIRLLLSNADAKDWEDVTNSPYAP